MLQQRLGPLEFESFAARSEVRETHLSRVFLGSELVVKFKKPVRFAFVTLETLEQRRQACEWEVALNRRLASDVYLAVLAAVRGPSGVRLLPTEEDEYQQLVSSPSPPEVLDYGVLMRRLPDEATALARLRSGTLTDADLAHLASELARFHAEVPRRPGLERHASPAAVAALVRSNLTECRAALKRPPHLEALAAAERYAEGFLRTEGGLLEGRVRRGRIVEGHGDLRLEHVYFEPSGKLSVIDCVEFSEALRTSDIAADIAFLVMDLRAEGRSDHGERFAAAYASAARDYELFRLLDFYVSYRAVVRAKVTALALAQRESSNTPLDESLEQSHERRIERHLAVAVPPARPRPTLLALGGLIGSGKSTLAEALARSHALVCLSTDRTRKELLGAGATESLAAAPYQGAYRAELSERVYAEVRERAGHVLASGRHAIIDASLQSRAERERLRELAQTSGARLRVVLCQAPEHVLLSRLRARAEGPSVSDGRAELLSSFRRHFEPMSELDSQECLAIDTCRDLDENLESVARFAGLG